MSTGNIENWAGEISEIGAIYPFVGTEFVLWIIGMGLFVLWLVIQYRSENKQYEDERKKYGNHETIKKLLDVENPEQF